MIGRLLRLLWRFLVGGVASFFAYFTIFLFFPYLKDNFPLTINLIILYVLIAYFGIPFLIRLWHLVLRPRHLPNYAVTRDGWSSDPVNIAIVCRSEVHLRKIMERAGWNVADKTTLVSSIKLGLAMAFKKSYKNAPFSSLYLFGRRQDIGFQIQTGAPASPRHRHHVRFWQLDAEAPEPHQHTSFWENILELFIRRRQQIWIGTATHDIGPFALRIQNLQITHKIDAETNDERDFVLQTLKITRSIKRQEIIKAGSPITFRGQTFGINITTDGTLLVVELKRPSHL